MGNWQGGKKGCLMSLSGESSFFQFVVPGLGFYPVAFWNAARSVT